MPHATARGVHVVANVCCAACRFAVVACICNAAIIYVAAAVRIAATASCAAAAAAACVPSVIVLCLAVACTDVGRAAWMASAGAARRDAAAAATGATALGPFRPRR